VESYKSPADRAGGPCAQAERHRGTALAASVSPASLSPLGPDPVRWLAGSGALPRPIEIAEHLGPWEVPLAGQARERVDSVCEFTREPLDALTRPDHPLICAVGALTQNERLPKTTPMSHTFLNLWQSRAQSAGHLPQSVAH
jgi:hypothetical protein